MFYIPFLLALALLGALWYWRERERLRPIRRWALQREMRFARHDLLQVHRRFHSLVLMRLGHGHRTAGCVFGLHRLGLWVGFFDQLDLGLGADRVELRRCIAAIEMPTGVELVAVPVPLARTHAGPLRTPLEYLGFEPLHDPQGAGRHVLYARRASVAHHPAARALLAAAREYPAEWIWEASEDVIMAACGLPHGPDDSAALIALLEAVAAAAERVERAQPTSPPDASAARAGPAGQGPSGLCPEQPGSIQ